MGLISSLVGATVAAVTVPLILQRISAANQPARQQDGFHVLEYSRGYRWLMLGCTCLFLGVLLLAYHFPGRTSPQQMPWVLLTFAGFASLSALTYFLMVRGWVCWNAERIEGPNAWGKRSSIAWPQLQGIEYVGWAQCFRLQGPHGEAIWLSPQMVGFQGWLDHVLSLGLLPQAEPDPGEGEY